MPQYQPALTNSAFEPAYLPAGPDRRADGRLPVPVAARIIVASSLGLWMVLWKLVASLLG